MEAGVNFKFEKKERQINQINNRHYRKMKSNFYVKREGILKTGSHEFEVTALV